MKIEEHKEEEKEEKEHIIDIKIYSNEELDKMKFRDRLRLLENNVRKMLSIISMVVKPLVD